MLKSENKCSKYVEKAPDCMSDFGGRVLQTRSHVIDASSELHA